MADYQLPYQEPTATPEGLSLIERLKRMPPTNRPAMTWTPDQLQVLDRQGLGSKSLADPSLHAFLSGQAPPANLPAPGGVSAMGYRGPDANATMQDAYNRMLADPGQKYQDLFGSLMKQMPTTSTFATRGMGTAQVFNPATRTYEMQARPDGNGFQGGPSGPSPAELALHAMGQAGQMYQNQGNALLGLGHIGNEAARNALAERTFEEAKSPEAAIDKRYVNGEISADQAAQMKADLKSIKPNAPGAADTGWMARLRTVDPKLGSLASDPAHKNDTADEFITAMYNALSDKDFGDLYKKSLPALNEKFGEDVMRKLPYGWAGSRSQPWGEAMRGLLWTPSSLDRARQKIREAIPAAALPQSSPPALPVGRLRPPSVSFKDY